MNNDENRDDDTLEEDVEETEEVEEQSEDEESDDEESEEDTPDWEAEAKKWKAIASRNKKKVTNKLKTKAEPEDDDIRSDVAFLKQSEKKRQFGYEHGLSPEETDKIFQLSPNPTADTLKDPFVKAGLEAIRRQKRVNDNTPSSSAKSNIVSSKKFRDLPAHEKQAKFAEAMKAKGITN